MTDIIYFLKGFLIGMAMAAPVGPIGLLCIHRTIMHGALAGFLGGIGAALADGLFGTAAAFGHAAVAGFLEKNVALLRIFGGLLLLAMAVRTWRRPISVGGPDETGRARHGLRQAVGDLVSTFFLTLTNPATFIAFMVVFAAMGVDAEEMGGNGPAYMIVTGVFAGSLAWWGILSLGVGLFRHKVEQSSLRIINIASAGVLAGIGGLVLAYQAMLLWGGR